MRLTLTRRDLPGVLILLAMVAGSIWGWLTIDGAIPLHWNLKGEVDRTGGKVEGLLLLPLIALGLFLLLRFLPRLDGGRAAVLSTNLGYALIQTAALLLLACIHLLVLLSASGHAASMSIVIPLLLGTVFISIGVAMPHLPQNRYAGIRTSWTLSSEDVWDRTHRIGGPLFMLAGGVVMLSAALPSGDQIGLILLAVLLPSVLLTLYSWWVFRQMGRGRYLPKGEQVRHSPDVQAADRRDASSARTRRRRTSSGAGTGSNRRNTRNTRR